MYIQTSIILVVVSVTFSYWFFSFSLIINAKDKTIFLTAESCHIRYACVTLLCHLPRPATISQSLSEREYNMLVNPCCSTAIPNRIADW